MIILKLIQLIFMIFKHLYWSIFQINEIVLLTKSNQEYWKLVLIIDINKKTSNLIVKWTNCFLLDVIVIRMANYFNKTLLLSYIKMSPKIKHTKMRADNIIKIRIIQKLLQHLCLVLYSWQIARDCWLDSSC